MGGDPLRALAAMSLSLACVSGFTMPAEMMILAASSNVMRTGSTLLRGTKHTKPEGGSMPVGMNTLMRSCPGSSLLISPRRLARDEHDRPDALGGKLHQRNLLEALAGRGRRHHRFEDLLQAAVDVAYDRRAAEHQFAGADQRAAQQFSGERPDDGQAAPRQTTSRRREWETAGSSPDCRCAAHRVSPTHRPP